MADEVFLDVGFGRHVGRRFLADANHRDGNAAIGREHLGRLAHLQRRHARAHLGRQITHAQFGHALGGGEARLARDAIEVRAAFDGLANHVRQGACGLALVGRGRGKHQLSQIDLRILRRRRRDRAAFAQDVQIIPAGNARGAGQIADIGSITGTIGQMSEIATAIAAAIEEQNAATSDIASNVQQAAQGTQEVSNNVTIVTTAIQESSAASSEVLATSGELARQAETLRSEVTRFIATIRAG